MAKRLQEKPRKQRSLRGMARHGLSILMAMVMVISLIQISAFADNQYAIGAQITLDSNDSSKLPTNIPDNAYWDGPQVPPAYITGEPTCGKEEHTHITATSCAHTHTADCYEDQWVPCTIDANPDHYYELTGHLGNPWGHRVDTGETYDALKAEYGAWTEKSVCTHECSAEAGCVTEDMLCKDCALDEHTHNTDPNSEDCCYEVVPAQYTWTLTEKGTMDNGMVVTGADVNVEEYHFLNSALAEMKAEAEANDSRLTQKGVTFTELKVEFQDGYKVNAGPIIGMWRATVQGITDHRQPENISGVTLYYYNWLKVQRYSYTFTPDQLRAILYEAPCGQVLDYAEVFLKDAPSTSTYYTVTFDYGYEFEEGVSTSYEYVKEGETVAEITPNRSGYSFDGWYLNDAKYDFSTPVTGDITLTARWTESTDPDPVTEVTNFYISLDGTVRDYVDENNNEVVAGHDTSYFSGSVYTGEMAATNHDYTLVGKANEAASTDAAIRALAPNTLKSIPSDDSVFAALRADAKMQAYCAANGMDINSITAANYNIYWYVVKCEDDGWHVDGVLVEKGEQPGYPVDYTVIHEYYTDGTKTGEVSQPLSGHVGDKVNAADLKKQLTDAQGNTYSYTSASAESIILTEDAATNKITLRYDRTTGGGNPGGGDTYYTLTVKYLEEGTDEELAPSYTSRIKAGTPYDVTAQTQVAIEGYIISDVIGKVEDNINGNVEIIVYYTVYIDDGETPLNPGPGGDGSGDGDTDIGDIEVPLDPGTGNGGTDIGDENVPLVPATGDNLALWVLAAVASAAGLVYLTVTGKKREQENG